MAQTQTQPVQTAFPGIGHTFVVDFGDYAVDLRFESDTRMSHTQIRGPEHGRSESVDIGVAEIRPDVWLVSWQETDRTSVVQIEDFEQGLVRMIVTGPDLRLVRSEGTMKRVS